LAVMLIGQSQAGRTETLVATERVSALVTAQTLFTFVHVYKHHNTFTSAL